MPIFLRWRFVGLYCSRELGTNCNSLDNADSNRRNPVQVNDASGAGMESSGTLESLAAGISRRFETDAQGAHRFGALPFGVYRLEVEREGFSTQVVEPGGYSIEHRFLNQPQTTRIEICVICVICG